MGHETAYFVIIIDYVWIFFGNCYVWDQSSIKLQSGYVYEKYMKQIYRYSFVQWIFWGKVKWKF